MKEVTKKIYNVILWAEKVAVKGLKFFTTI